MSKRKQTVVAPEKIQEQERYIESMREYTSRLTAIRGRKPKVLIQTFGCPKV